MKIEKRAITAAAYLELSFSLLFAGCGQIAPDENISAVPGQGEIETLPDKAPPEKTIPTEENSDNPYEKYRDVIEEFSYTPGKSDPLYMRYHGTLDVTPYANQLFEYTVDLIKLDDPFQMLLYLQIDSHYAVEDFRQTFAIPVDDYYEDSAAGIYITDLNGDGAEDFIIDLGRFLTDLQDHSIFFVFDPEERKYKMLGWLCDATFYKDEMAVYEYKDTRANGETKAARIVRNKYIIEGVELVLKESLIERFRFNDSFEMRFPFPAYTLQKLENGEIVTVYQNAPEEEVDFSDWPQRDQRIRVK